MANLTLHSKLEELIQGKSIPKYLRMLKEADLKTVEDLLWTAPKDIKTLPPIGPFTRLMAGELFRGRGSIVRIQKFFPKKSSRFQRSLMNLEVLVSDLHSTQTIKLKWFNVYPSILSKLESNKHICFWGKQR